MSTLLISLPLAQGLDGGAGAAPSYSYALSPDGEAISQQGSTTAGLLPQPGRAGEVVAVVPAALLEMIDKNGVIRAQVMTAVPMLIINILLMYFLAFPGK